MPDCVAEECAVRGKSRAFFFVWFPFRRKNRQKLHFPTFGRLASAPIIRLGKKEGKPTKREVSLYILARMGTDGRLSHVNTYQSKTAPSLHQRVRARLRLTAIAQIFMQRHPACGGSEKDW